MAIPALTRDFKEFLKSLNSHHAEYLLMGGTRQNAARIELALREFGFASSALSAGLFLAPNNVVRMGVPPIRVGILTSISGVEFAACYAERTTVQIEDISVPVISSACLRRNEAAGGRAKDLADLENLPQ